MWKDETHRVLIINDSINSVLELKEILKVGGFAVSSCCGEQAIQAVMEESPDVILLEILLKKRNGFEVLTKLKSNGRTSHIPVVIISSLNLQIYWDESFILGASAYMVKGRHYPWLRRKLYSILYNRKIC
ncbi:response regulator [Sunxiuqinia sp. A32]|uniref:response regulator n=1 Tax=Sunxiuqinia sp. A32 TaxID=3461496 RepID=UPI004045A99B